ncbi:MAG: CorA family divalent cation transporter [Candidatus Pacebacteria bacterium]|nr:CorA family divalent cation transporter [Candidatus Paceibacterota bacterium]
MQTIKNKSIIWIDILKPTAKDIEFIKKQHKFHPIILDELSRPSVRARVEGYDSYLFLTYHIPTYDPILKTSKKAEIDFLITKNTVITVHYEELEPINDFIRNLSANQNLKDIAMSDTGRLTYKILEDVINFSLRQLRHIEENVSFLNKELFSGKESGMLKEISYAKRDILDYRMISRPQEIILKSLRETGMSFWGTSINVYLSDLVGEHMKVLQQIENFKETIESIEQTNAQLLHAKSTAIMQKFNVLAFLAVPMAFTMAFFTVGAVQQITNFSFFTFVTTFIIVAILDIFLLIIFRKKKWL